MPEIYKSKGSENKDQIEKLLGGTYGTSSFSAFRVNPDNLDFESRLEEEKIVILGRAHFIVNFKWIAVICFAFFIPMFWGEFPFLKALDDKAAFGITSLWYLGLMFYGIQSFLLWFYNVYIVTDERLVDVDFLGLLSKTVNVTQLSKVEDVNYSQNGMFANMFNYGDVVVQTASEQKTQDASGELSAFTFENIAHPDKVASVISQLVEDEENERR